MIAGKMEKNIAEQLIKKFLDTDEPLNAAVKITEQIKNEEERIKFRRGVAEIMGRIYTDLELPIIRQYPELDPDK